MVDDDIDSDSDGHKSRVCQTSVGSSQLELGSQGTDASDRFNYLLLGPQARVLKVILMMNWSQNKRQRNFRRRKRIEPPTMESSNPSSVKISCATRISTLPLDHSSISLLVITEVGRARS